MDAGPWNFRMFEIDVQKQMFEYVFRGPFLPCDHFARTFTWDPWPCAHFACILHEILGPVLILYTLLHGILGPVLILHAIFTWDP